MTRPSTALEENVAAKKNESRRSRNGRRMALEITARESRLNKVFNVARPACVFRLG